MPIKIACLCPTFLRPKELATSIECFLRQDYPDELRELIVLDDAGQYDPGALDGIPGVRLVTSPVRFRTLGDKRNASAALVSPIADAYCVWDDDDVYLPWHISACVEALGEADYTIPSALYVDKKSYLLRRTNDSLFHGAWSFTRKAFEQVGGYPWIQSGQDQGFLARLKAASLRRADPIKTEPRPSYVYRWFTGPSRWHLSAMGCGGYERLADREVTKVDRVIPAWDRDWVKMAN